MLVQSGLYPHAGYEERVQLLTPEALLETQNAGVAVLLAPAISAYPFQSEDRAWLGAAATPGGDAGRASRRATLWETPTTVAPSATGYSG